jgi:hypothetical protein
MLKFQVEQIAICPTDPAAAKQLLKEIGAVDWSEDHVCAEGSVFGYASNNEANLSFNYGLVTGNEFEVLDYTTGINWMESFDRQNSVSHLGMHCSAEELAKWREFFSARNIQVAQEVVTQSHTNPAIKDSRRYNYVIFDTKAVLGVDLKFIVRLEA